MDGTYFFEPQISPSSYLGIKNVNWDTIDQKASEVIKSEVVAIPSVRVGIFWVLEYLNYHRHDTDVLVPNFLSSCILNAITRRAAPVKQITANTKLAILVHQFGFTQDFVRIKNHLAGSSISFIEDSAHGIAVEEKLLPGSMGKFINFSKLLPVLKGAGFLSSDSKLVAFMKDKRRQSNWCSWFIFWVFANMRRKRFFKSSIFHELAFDLYTHSPGDNWALLNNFYRGLQSFDRYCQITWQRAQFLQDKLGDKIMLPHEMRLLYQVPFFAQNNQEKIAEVLKRRHFDCQQYHFDLNRNLFAPHYEKVFLLPINPTIPEKEFNALILELSLWGRNNG